MKFNNFSLIKKIYFNILIILLFITKISSGIIEPDDILPLEISPSYEEKIGKIGTKFVFRFYIPNYADKDSMPTMRGYGATNGQYIGIRFAQNDLLFDAEKIYHQCDIIQVENNLNIPLVALNDENQENVIYCKIDSYSNEKILLPGYNYKLTLTIINDLRKELNNLISITIFTSTLPNSEKNEIIDIGTFNHINIITPHDRENQLHSIAYLTPVNSLIDVEVETNINFDISINFNGWFSWDDYVICLDIPKNQISAENPRMEIDKPSGSNIEIPLGDIININLESNDNRKFIGFFLDGSDKENNAGDILLLKFSGLKTKDAGLIYDDISNSYIGIEIRYRNSYVICSSGKIYLQVSLGNVQFSVKHPESSDDGSYKFDVFRGGAFQIEFNIKTEKNVYNKYIVIKQKNSDEYQRVTFIASSCDFSDFNITSNNFNEIPKCNPIKNKNDESSVDYDNGIFFYYPYIIQANTNYKLRVWMFFDECGPEEEGTTYEGDRTKIEIKFSLQIYNDINKNKIGPNRFDSSFIFLNELITENGIICYNTYMGDKKYNNGYLFNMEDYVSDNKTLYREYFDWNVFEYKSDSSIDENEILNNLFSSKEKTPKFIYSKNNKLEDGNHLLLVSKITLDSGNNEKLGQFFPMGLTRDTTGKKIPIKGKFFIKLSQNFFAKTDTSNCYVSWAFGSPSIGPDKFEWKPKSKAYRFQKYNFIISSKAYFSDDSTALFEPLIEKIEDNYLESKVNEGWDTTKALWSFGSDENLEDQISDEAPVEVYFALADTCHVWKNVDQNIKSLYTPIEIIIGITGETTDYSRVMRFIKLYPEGGVWHDNTIDEGSDIFIRSSSFIIKNHFAYNKIETNDNSKDKKGVCLLEIAPGIVDSQKALSSNFFLWIFMGSLLETEYPYSQTPYPIGNLADGVQAYGYSSQHSLNINNFYAKVSKTQISDITSPIYSLAHSMTSLYQSASSGYLFYLGSLIVFYNKIKRNSMYDLPSDPILIPYYCPYYISNGEEKPFSLGNFPSFIAGFASFESMTNFGNKGFEKFVGMKINEKQINVLMLSDIKIYQKKFKTEFQHFYNTVKFMNDFNKNIMTLNVWNSDKENPCLNEYDSIDSFIFFFSEKVNDINNAYPRSNIPERLKSITKSKKGNYCFYVYGKKFCSGIYGVTNSDLLLTRNVPSTGDTNPYLSININFEITQDLLICESNPDKFCPVDAVAFWGISSNHDMSSYVTNYLVDSYLLDYHIYTEYINNDVPSFELGQSLAFKNDPAIFVKIIFKSPFKTAILNNTMLSFTIKDYKDANCSVQSSDINLPSVNCDTDTDSGEISCKLVYSSLQYNIFCYGLNYGTNGRFYFNNFKLNLLNDENYKSLGSLIFHNTTEYIYNLGNILNEPSTPTIQGNYITTPFNLYSYSKLELTIDLKRPAHPGMIIELIFDKQDYIDEYRECKFSLEKIHTYSMSDIDIDNFWTKGNANIYNCIIEKDISSGSPIYKVIAQLDHKLYKAGNELSNLAYIYIWPFNTIVLENYVTLSVTVNNRDILSSDSIIYFSNINQYVDMGNSALCGDIFTILASSNIYGDLSDYKFTRSSSASITNTISLVQIFFPKDINFECEECVKCYEISSTGATSMITCNFEDINILNVFSQAESFIVTGIINPKKINNKAKIYINMVNIDSYGNRNSMCSNNFFLEDKITFIHNPTIGHLKFFYIDNVVSDSNPRNMATYTFHFSFDYANKNYPSNGLPGLSADSLMFIYFPKDYHLYINDEPSSIIVRYFYSDGTNEAPNIESKILGRKLMIKLKKETNVNIKIKYIEIVINSIKNPNKIINENKYTGYFKIVCLNNPSLVQTESDKQYYYITGINSNTFRSNFISDEKERSGEYNWYRGLLIKTNSTYIDKLILDVLYDKKIYDFIFLQPGRYTKVHFITSSDNENIANFYLNPNSTQISFSSNTAVNTLNEIYIIPSLLGDSYEFYIGVPCNTNDGIYVVTPEISNSDAYISPPDIIINVRQIETAKIEFIQDDVGISPLDGKLRVYYYLSDINVDEMYISWTQKTNPPNKKIIIDRIAIPAKTITNITKKYSNVFTTAIIELIEGKDQTTGGTYYFVSSDNINRCYEMNPKELAIKEIVSINFLDFATFPSYKLSNDLIIKTSENDDSISSNEIKFYFNPPLLVPSFIFCELYCPYLTADSKEDLHFVNFDSMSTYLNEVKQSYFRKYASNYFYASQESASLIFPNVIKGYNYNAQCIYQTTQSNSDIVKYESFPFTSDNLHSAFPPKTQCNTFYFINAIKKETQEKYIYYCQYVIGKILGNNGCAICSDCSGKILAPGYSIYFPFNCQNEQCYDYSTNSLLDEMYELTEEFNIKSETTKYEFTICVTSNRICDTQITDENLYSGLNQFVNDVKDNKKANELFQIDYNDDNYIIYNGFYQNKIYSEYEINIDDIEIEFIEELSSNGSAVIKASYNQEINNNLLCFWRIKLNEETAPTLEEMTNCKTDEFHCGVFVANYGGHQYKIPEERRKNIAEGVYSMYITCSHFVPSPIYFSKIKNIMTKEVKNLSFSGNILYINYIYLLIFIFLIL